MDILDISWGAYTQALDILVTKVSDSDSQFAILGVSRGGLIPTVVLSHALPDSRFDIVYCTSYTGITQLPEVTIHPPVSYTIAHIPERILVVDDLIDTGRTMVTISNWLELFGFVQGAGPGRCFKIAVVYDKVRPGRAIQADIVGETLAPEAWVKFPYEIQLTHNT